MTATRFIHKPAYRVFCIVCGTTQLGFIDGKSLYCSRCARATTHRKVEKPTTVVDYEEEIRRMHETDA